jgi:hypothetical protein
VVACAHTVLSCELRKCMAEFHMFGCDNSDQVPCVVGKNTSECLGFGGAGTHYFLDIPHVTMFCLLG